MTEDDQEYLRLVNGTRFVKLRLRREIERKARWQRIRRKAAAVVVLAACLGMSWVLCRIFLAFVER